MKILLKEILSENKISSVSRVLYFVKLIIGSDFYRNINRLTKLIRKWKNKEKSFIHDTEEFRV